MSKAAAFISGLTSGYVVGHKMNLQNKADERAEAEEKRKSEEHALNKQIKEIGVRRLKAEEPLFDKELQVRGARADFNLSEQNFLNEMQQFEQGTRKLLSEANRTKAQTGAVAAGAEAQQQPDQIRLAREELNAKIADTIQRQTANVWNVLRLGNKDVALKMFNDSKLLMPGTKAKDFALEEIDGPAGADGKPQKVRVLSIIPEGAGQPVRIPVTQLEALANRYGAKYEKVGSNLVRIGPDGSVTPIYEQDQYMTVPEDGHVVSKKTGLPPAAGGIGRPGAGAVPGSGKKEARVDSRVKMAIDKVILPRYGGRFEGGMFFPDEKNKDVATRAIVLAGERIRRGENPEAAGAAAIEQAEREKLLRDPNAGKGGTPGGYTGPTPWRR